MAGAQSLVLDFDGSRMPDGLLGQLLHTMDGPAKLISAVNQIIGGNGTWPLVRWGLEPTPAIRGGAPDFERPPRAEQ